MGPVGIAIGAIGLVTGAVGAYKSHQAQKKQMKFQKRAQAAQRAQDNMRAARERREAIRNARIAAAEVTQAGVNQGVGDSSAVLGSLGSIGQQLNQGLSFLDGMNRLSDQASTALGHAAQAGVNAGMWQSVSGLGMKVFEMAGNMPSGGGGGS